MTIIGKITKINAINGAWASCTVSTDTNENVNCVGNLPGIVLGMRIKAEGEYKEHSKYGMQFNVEQCDLEVDYTKEYALQYLKSGAVKGVGIETAKRIVDTFGDETMRVLESDDNTLLAQVPGIGKRKAQKIHQAYAENNVYRKLLGYANISISKADKLYTTYGNEALSMIRYKPYQIIYDVDGFGFKTVDEIALKNGWDPSHPDRIGAAIIYLLTQFQDEGHCFCTIAAIEENIKSLIPGIGQSLFQDVLMREVKKGHLVLEDGNIVYLKKLYDAETHIASNIAMMLKRKPDYISQFIIDKAISEMEAESGFSLEQQQKDAVNLALKNRVSVITGGPGTGKSTIIKAITKAWMSKYRKNADPNEHILLCAPTGKAARRMTERTGYFAETVQRIIAKQRNEDAEPIDNKLIIIDESSMIDILLANAISRLPSAGDNNIVFIGDANQLPPIGPGNFFRDVVSSPCLPCATLSLCHRQSGTIAINANRVNEGRGYATLNFDHESCKFIYAVNTKARAAILNEYQNLLSLYDVRDICVLVPMRKRGKSMTSADDLNDLIRDIVNPIVEGDIQLEGCPLRIGDRVMYTSNDYEKEIFNGDCGIIQDFDTEFNTVVVEMDDGREIELSKAASSHLILAYAMTVHKSQGSEYKGIIIAHNREHAFMLQRNLLYTAITRAKEKVTIIGEPAAINIAISKVASLERQTRLIGRIASSVVKSYM